MKDQTENDLKKNAATSASSAAGAIAGMVIGTVLSPQDIEAQEVTAHTSGRHQPTGSSALAQPDASELSQTSEQSQKPEVIAYDRITDDDGTKMDIALVRADGRDLNIVDLDLDGEADIIICDLNQNGVADQGEVTMVQGAGLEMQPLQDVAGFDPLFAQNDLPDYVDNADVGTYMA